MIDELAEMIFDRQKEKDQYLNAEWFKTLFQFKYTSYNRFLGDRDYFFEFDENENSFKLSEYAKEEIEKVLCFNCQNRLSDKLANALLYNASTSTSLKLDIECELGMLCPKCGMLTDINNLIDRKIIGNLSIYLKETLFHYITIKEIFSYLDRIEGVEFTVEQYMYP